MPTTRKVILVASIIAALQATLVTVVMLTSSGVLSFHQYDDVANHDDNIEESFLSLLVDGDDDEDQTSVGASRRSSSSAMDIVQQTYENTYAHLVEDCRKEDSFLTCVKNMYQKTQSVHLNNVDNDDDDDDDAGRTDKNQASPSSSSWVHHWWFQSMMRDAANKGDENPGLHAGYHVGQAKDPNVTMCIMQKIAFKQWRTIFQNLNGISPQSNRLRPDGSNGLRLPHVEGYPSILVLRDPLDRFLSAYLDKCVDPDHRKREAQCWPNEVYRHHKQENFDNPLTAGFSFGGDDDKLKDRNMEGHKQIMFSMYVDTMPLRWNLHFYPQSFYCDGLFRFIDDYDSVGHMGPQFYSDLHKIGRRYGGRFEKELIKVFDYPSKLKSAETETETEKKDIHTGTETKAADKIMEYYTPKSLRRVLEYVSIDYMLLGLKIPDWAEEMLREEYHNGY